MIKEPVLHFQKNNPLWLFAFGLVALFLPVCLILCKVLNYTQGVFMYPYDDTFIHLTLADNLLKGHWGINENEFASASSSLLYTLILAFARLFSHSVLVPFIVNCIAGIAILCSVHFWLTKHQVSYIAQGMIFLLVIFFTPLPLVIISGMEHTLQCLFSFLFIFYFSDWLENAKSLRNERVSLKVLLFAVLTSTIRYEGVFLIAIACLLLLMYRKILPALVLAFVALLPLVIFGWISVNKGSYFFPNSVLVKSGSFNYSDPVQVVYTVLFDKLVYARNGMASLATQRLMIIVPLLYLVFRKYLTSSYTFILIFLFAATILQLSFASTGYLYRYEAYLFFCLMIITPVLFYKYGRPVLNDLISGISKFIAFALVFFLLFPVVLRSITALDKTSQGCINIYDQQYQMALFSKKYYNQSAIALNDIGAMAYFTDARIVDLWGLANTEVTKSKKNHYWTPPFLDSLCRSKQVAMGIIYDTWFPDSLTKRWNKVASWQIQNNVICGDDSVSFYSLQPFSQDILRQRLKEFEPQLPGSVKVKYY
jgi:hypothetical protein